MAVLFGKRAVVLESLSTRTWWFLSLGTVFLAVFRSPLYLWAALALRDERYTYTLFVPLISAGAIWVNRHKILVQVRCWQVLGIPAILLGIGLLIEVGKSSSITRDSSLWASVLAIYLMWIGLFVLCYGLSALKKATFPFLFLLFMIPLPDGLMNTAVIELQKGSAAVTAGLFRLIRMPFMRDGFTFALPGINIEIAKECSGIRSTVSIFLCGLLAAVQFLQSSWRRILFVLLIVPVVIFKNAVRIATIAWLGVYVDRSFFFGKLHHYGGLPFSLIAFAILGATLLMLRGRKPVPVPA